MKILMVKIIQWFKEWPFEKATLQWNEDNLGFFQWLSITKSWIPFNVWFVYNKEVYFLKKSWSHSDDSACCSLIKLKSIPRCVLLMARNMWCLTYNVIFFAFVSFDVFVYIERWCSVWVIIKNRLGECSVSVHRSCNCFMLADDARIMTKYAADSIGSKYWCISKTWLINFF